MALLYSDAIEADNTRERCQSTEEVLALYQRWLSTRDPVIENQLRPLGIDLDSSEQPQ